MNAQTKEVWINKEYTTVYFIGNDIYEVQELDQELWDEIRVQIVSTNEYDDSNNRKFNIK